MCLFYVSHFIAFKFFLCVKDSKSLWHQMAHALMLVRAEDRDDFMDICMSHHTLCDERNFEGPKADFEWESGFISPKAKVKNELRLSWSMVLL